jgi:hypothetical protein
LGAYDIADNFSPLFGVLLGNAKIIVGWWDKCFIGIFESTTCNRINPNNPAPNPKCTASLTGSTFTLCSKSLFSKPLLTNHHPKAP